jgi:Fe-S cluster assembly protein SufD
MTLADKDIAREIVDSFSPFQFNEAAEFRKKAVESLQKIGLPKKKNEEYRFTPITSALEKNLTWTNKVPFSSIDSIDEYLIHGFDCNLLVFINGSFSQKLSKMVSPSSQVEIKSLSDAFLSDSSSLGTYFDTLSNQTQDPFALLNSAFWQEGVFIKVPENATVEHPIHILYLFDSKNEQVIAHNRIFVLLNKGSKLSIVETFDSIGENHIFNTFSEEVIIKENASLEYCKIQNDKGKSYQVANSLIHQESSSRVDTYTLITNGTMVRNNFSIELDGEKCESHFNGLYLLNGNALADNHTAVDHKKPNSFSNELYKGVMADNSKGIFNGKIFVRPQAQKTNAFQSNRNILLSETATINTKPQLEIWADDVKCSHGCTTGQLDEEALFYLRSRGIPAKEAKALLLYAFTSETLKNITNESLRAYLEKLISNRLSSN